MKIITETRIVFCASIFFASALLCGNASLAQESLLENIGNAITAQQSVLDQGDLVGVNYEEIVVDEEICKKIENAALEREHTDLETNQFRKCINEGIIKNFFSINTGLAPTSKTFSSEDKLSQ